MHLFIAASLLGERACGRVVNPDVAAGRRVAVNHLEIADDSGRLA